MVTYLNFGDDKPMEDGYPFVGLCIIFVTYRAFISAAVISSTGDIADQCVSTVTCSPHRVSELCTRL